VLALALAAGSVHASSVDAPLIVAAKNGQLADVVSELAQGQNPNVTGIYGYTPAMWAISRGSLPILQALLAHGGSLPAATANYIPLVEAAKSGNTDIVGFLLKQGDAVNARDSQGDTALFWAVERGNADTASALITAGADVNAANARSQTALIVAAQLGETDLINLLASQKANLNARDSFGYTALIWAAHNGFAAAAKALVAAGADVSLQGKDGLTAKAVALSRGYAGLAQSL